MSRAIAGPLVGAIVILACAGCVTEDAQGRPVRKHREQQQPEGLVVGRVAQGIYNLTAVDSNDNGILDTILVLVWLFSTDPTYASPIWAEGHLEFTLKGQDGELIRSWTFTSEETQSARRVIGEVGPGYTVPLGLGEEVEQQISRGTVRAWLSCRFVPAQGDGVDVPEPDDVLIGWVGRPR